MSNTSGFLRSFELGTAACAFAIAVVAQVLYAIHFYKPHFQSDDAVLNLLAESMWKQGSLFPEGWISNNGDLMVPSGALLIAPFLSWLPNGFGLHAIAGVFAIVVMLAAFLWLLRHKVRDASILLVAGAFCASGLSWYCAHVLYQQTTYLWWPAGFFAGAALIWKRRQSKAPAAGSRWIGTMLFLLVAIVCFANPARTCIMLVLPLYAFDRALMASSGGMNGHGAVRRWLERSGARDRFVVTALGAAFLVAAAAYAGLMSAGIVSTDYSASNLHWADGTAIWKNLSLFLDGWFPLLGSNLARFNWREGVWNGSLEIARFLFALWLSWVGVSECSGVRRQKDPLRRALTLAFLAAFLPTFFLYVFFVPLAVDLSTMRYFTVPLFILLALATVHAAALPRRNGLVFPLVLAALSVVVALTSAQRFVFYAHQPWTEFWRVGSSNPMRLAATLEREGLKWGYATWWNAGATTVMSDGAVRVSPITLTNGELRPYPAMVQRAWYASESWHGETFLALDFAEASPQNLQLLNATLGPPKRIIEASAQRVLVYDHNIMD
ncbi:MAG: hypothetical protein WAS23_01790 [Dokdonella sp.]|uniref:hypothetical protein n=1 Tax=Dokdonella sp. TaxID=2291710 RepID=UPI003BAE8C8D